MSPLARMSALVAGVILLAGAAQAMPIVTVPVGLTDVDGSLSHTLLTNAGSRVQQIIYDNSVLAAAGITTGTVLNGVAFRANGGATGATPAISFGDWTVRIGVAATPAATATANFDSNVTGGAGGYVTVRSGPLSLGAGYFPATGAAVNGFSVPIGFSTPFVYTGAGQGLVVTFTHDSGSANIFLDAFIRGTQTGIASFNATTAAATDEAANNLASGSTTVVGFDVPEPMALSLLALGGIALAGVRRRR